MKKVSWCLAVITLVGLATLSTLGGVARSQGDQMAPPKAGPESMALDKYFGKSVMWTGQVAAGVMGPGSMATTSHGKAMCHKTLDGFWYTCEVEDMMGAGKDAVTWKGHMFVGYDLGTKAYKGVAVDNMGMLTMFDGTMSDNTFVLETPQEVMMMGQMMKDRMTWEMGAGGMMTFKDEHQMGGGDWMLAESGTMKPMATMKGKMAKGKGEASEMSNK